MSTSDPGLLLGVLFNALIVALPPVAVAIIALVRARRSAAPGMIGTAGVLFLGAGLLGALFQVLWVLLPRSLSDPLTVLSVMGLVQTVVVGAVTTTGLLFLVLGLWRARAGAARPVPARGGYGHGGGDAGSPAYHGDHHGYRGDGYGHHTPQDGGYGAPAGHHGGEGPDGRHAGGGGPEAPPAQGQPGDPGSSPSQGAPASSASPGSPAASGSSGGGFWSGLFGGGDSGGGWSGWGGGDSGGGWGGGDSGGGGGDGGGGGGGD